MADVNGAVLNTDDFGFGTSDVLPPQWDGAVLNNTDFGTSDVLPPQWDGTVLNNTDFGTSDVLAPTVGGFVTMQDEIIFYKMRAEKTLGGWAVWVVTVTPDFTGTSAGVSIVTGTAVIASTWKL